MTMPAVAISHDNPRNIRAMEIPSASGQWAKCYARDGRKWYGIPSQRGANLRHLANCVRLLMP